MNGCLVTVVGGALSPGAKVSHRGHASPWESILADPLRAHMHPILRNRFMSQSSATPSFLRSLMRMDSGEISYIQGVQGGVKGHPLPHTCTGLK